MQEMNNEHASEGFAVHLGQENFKGSAGWLWEFKASWHHKQSDNG